MALGFKIADGYVEVHADYDKSELRDAAQDAADDFGDEFSRSKEHDAAGRASGRKAGLAWAEGFFLMQDELKKRPLITVDSRSQRHANVAGRRFAAEFGRGFRTALGDVLLTGMRNPKINRNVIRRGHGAGTSFALSFIEAVTLGMADLPRAFPRTKLAQSFARAGIALGLTFAGALIVKIGEAITALSPLLLGALAAIPIVFLAKTDKEVKAKLKAWKKDMSAFMKDISKPVKPGFLKALDEIRDGFNRMRAPVKEFFSVVGRGLPIVARGLVDGVGAFFRSLKPALPGILAGLKQWGIEFPKIGKAIGAAFATILKNPALVEKAVMGLSRLIQSIVGVAAKIVNVLTWIAAAYNSFTMVLDRWESTQAGFLGRMPAAWQRVVDAFRPVKQAILDVWNAFKSFALAKDADTASERFRILVDKIKAVWGPVKDFIAEVWRLAWNKVKEVWNTTVKPWLETVVMPWLKQKGKELINAMMDELVNQAKVRFTSFVQSIPGMLSGLASAISQPFMEAKDKAYQKTRELVDKVGTTLRGLPGKAKAALSGLWGSISGAFTTSATNAGRKARELVDKVVPILRGLPGKAKSAVSGLWSSMSGSFTSSARNAGTQAGALVRGFITKLSPLASQAATKARAAKTAIIGAFSGAASWLYNAGRDIISGLARGITSATSWVRDAAVRAANAAKAAAKSALGISSPSKVFAEEVGKPAAQGIAVGLRKRSPDEMRDLRKSLPQLRLPEAAMAGAGAAGGGGAFSPTVNLYMQPGFYSENAAAKRALTKDVFLALEQYRKDYER